MTLIGDESGGDGYGELLRVDWLLVEDQIYSCWRFLELILF